MSTFSDSDGPPERGLWTDRNRPRAATARPWASRGQSRRVGRLLAAAVLAGSAWGILPSTAGAADPSPYCLQTKTLQVLTTCASVEASVDAKVRANGIELTITNDSDAEWNGRPVAAETTDLTAKGEDVTAVNADMPTASAELVVREDVVVSRCVFPPTVEAHKPGASISCVVPGTPKSDEIVIWLTGFIEGIPLASVEAGLGTEPTPLGVIPVATPRSIRLNVSGAVGQDAEAEVIDPRTIDVSPVGIEQKEQSAVKPALVAGGVAAAGLGGVVLWQRRRRAAGQDSSG